MLADAERQLKYICVLGFAQGTHLYPPWRAALPIELPDQELLAEYFQSI